MENAVRVAETSQTRDPNYKLLLLLLLLNLM